MYKFINILCLTFVLSVAAFAQTNTDEYKKNEYYVGYSNQQFNNVDFTGLHGAEGSYVRNVHRYFGIKADASFGYRRDKFNFSGSDQTNGNYSYTGKYSTSVYNFLGGVQVKNNASKARFKPFAHALAGVAVRRFKNSPLICTSGTCPTFINNANGGTFTNTNFALALGGGLDIKINDKIDFRAIQVDYNPIFGLSSRQDNFRFGIGVVFK